MHKMAARAMIMKCDFNISIDEAVAWVTRNLPKGLKEYYTTHIMLEMCWLFTH